MIAPIDPASTLERNYPLIQRIVSGIAFRNGLDPSEGDELTSWAVERLVDHDYAILRKFDSRGSFRGFLGTVLERLTIDYRNAHWGRWRASAAAKQLGRTAVRLERLVYRDRRPVREAIERLRAEGVPEDETELRRLLQHLPMRWPAQTVDLTAAADVAASTGAESSGERTEQARALEDMKRALTEALGGLPSEDQLIIRLLFWEQLSVADVARRLSLVQKPLYRRIEALRGRLRTELERRGVSGDQLSSFLASDSLAESSQI